MHDLPRRLGQLGLCGDILGVRTLVVRKQRF